MDYTLITAEGHTVDFSTTDTLQDIKMELVNSTFFHFTSSNGIETILRCSVIEAVTVKKSEI